MAPQGNISHTVRRSRSQARKPPQKEDLEGVYPALASASTLRILSAKMSLKQDVSFIDDNVTGGTMPAEEKMTIDEGHRYLRMMRKWYRQATRNECGHLLDETECMTGLNPKTLIRHMSSRIAHRPRAKQRGMTYGHDRIRHERIGQDRCEHAGGSRRPCPNSHLSANASKVLTHPYLLR